MPARIHARNPADFEFPEHLRRHSVLLADDQRHVDLSLFGRIGQRAVPLDAHLDDDVWIEPDEAPEDGGQHGVGKSCEKPRRT
jgi:hypothetical protein